MSGPVSAPVPSRRSRRRASGVRPPESTDPSAGSAHQYASLPAPTAPLPQHAGDPSPAPPKTTRKGWTLTAKIITWTISIVSFATGIIAVVPILFRNASSFDALYLEVTPYAGSRTDWALPVDADFAAFPAGSGDVCSAEQRAWLEANGTSITTEVLVDMRNTASEGPMLTLKNFSLAGDRSSNGDPLGIRVVCDTAQPSPLRVQAARLDATSESNVAVFAAAAFGATTEGLPDTPAAWNLAPGETGQMVISVFAGADVTGELQAIVVSGNESRTESLGAAAGVHLVPLIDSGRTYLRAGAGLSCLMEGTGGVEPCDAEHVLEGS